jgi:Domain of unknown function (DUF4440)
MEGAMMPSTRWARRRSCYVALAALALFAGLAEMRAQPAGGEEAAVLTADKALGNAMRSGDRSLARKLLSLQFTYADEDGKVHERKAFLDDLKGVAGAAPSGVKVKIYGLVAMVTGERKSARGGDAVFLEIWAQQKGAWRALTMQDVVLGRAAAPSGPPPAPDAKPYECKNPCQTIPYRVRSPAEQDVVNAFQAIRKAEVARDASEWAKHVADEFALYASGRPPVTKSGRIAAIEQQKKDNATVTVSEIASMRLVVYGDGAAMVASHAMPDNSRPPYRAARVWVKRNGQWQLAVSVQTDIKAP